MAESKQVAVRKHSSVRRPDARYIKKGVQPTGGTVYTAKPAYLDLIREKIAEGVSEASIARAANISPHTLSEMKKRDAVLRDAFTTGYGDLADTLTNPIMDEVRKGNWVAALALGKTRLGWRDSGAATAEDHKPQQVNIQINAPMSAEDFAVQFLQDNPDDDTRTDPVPGPTPSGRSTR